MKIIETATGLFRDHGYNLIKITDICEKANVSVGAFYHHFKSKEDIINDVFKEIDFVLKDKLEDYKFIDAYDEINIFIKEQVGFTQEWGCHIATEIFKNQLTAEFKYILDENRYFYTGLKQAIERGIANNELISTLSPKEITDMILRLSRGVIYDWCLREGKYNLVERVSEDLNFLLDNLRQK